MSGELWTVVIDAVVSVATVAVGLWVLPQYQEFALAIVAALQGIAAALVVHFRSERKIGALETRAKKLELRR